MIILYINNAFDSLTDVFVARKRVEFRVCHSTFPIINADDEGTEELGLLSKFVTGNYD